MIAKQPLEFGALLKRRRIVAGLSQEALAERAGISARAVAALEQGVNRAPQRYTVEKLSVALGLGAEGRADLEATISRRRVTHSSTGSMPTSPCPPGTRTFVDGQYSGDNTFPWSAAKVSPPRPQAIASRRRLLEPLSSVAAAGRLCFVVAPGGCGKTSLLANWAHHAHTPVAWYALDAADRDPRRLIDGLCAAIEHALPGTTDPVRAALRDGAGDTAALGLLLGALDGQSMALVLDDFHHLDGASDALALWDHLLRFRPPTLTLIVLSRSIPDMGFAALSSLDVITSLGSTDLRFDAGEATDLLSAHGLAAGAADDYAAYSGGWAAGVLLLAHSAQSDVAILRARTGALMEHLGSEVLAALPPGLRRFLVESAALGPASPEDADAVLGRRDSAALYAEAAARGLFLEYDDGLYRYHDLFAEYLVGALRAEDPGRLRAAKRVSSSTWLLNLF